MKFFPKPQNVKAEPKTITLYNRELINRLTEEEAYYENTTPSAIIEHCILTELLPKDFMLYSSLYDVYSQQTDLQNALINLFSTLAVSDTHSDSRRVKENIILIQYIRSMVGNTTPHFSGNSMFNGDYCSSYLIHQIECINLRLERLQHQNPQLHLPIELIKKYSSKISNYDESTFNMLFTILLDNWEFIYDQPEAYKIGMEICKLAHTDIFDKANLAELRKQLLSLEKNWPI